MSPYVPVLGWVVAMRRHGRACRAAEAFHRRGVPAPPEVMSETWAAFDQTFTAFAVTLGTLAFVFAAAVAVGALAR